MYLIDTQGFTRFLIKPIQLFLFLFIDGVIEFFLFLFLRDQVSLCKNAASKLLSESEACSEPESVLESVLDEKVLIILSVVASLTYHLSTLSACPLVDFKLLLM